MTLPFGAQDLAVGGIAAGALGWLVWRRVRRTRRGTNAACENCAAAAPPPRGVRPAPQPEILLGIGEPPAKRD